MQRWIIIACLAGLASACSSPSDDATESAADKPEHVWQDQVDTLEKARGVEQTLMDARQQRDEKLRKQE
ncbi:hypothetical protein DFR30_0598 [Thiogranum longum]|uniref:Uncharacterized protein n=1 Tax=Thiogranum longum TaxID=1537524 RepID=A0A4R1HDK0_9GAMM|nr:hypothetical protein [Thiogranum longum]TCK17369.1 hypothetical protein DFR30_0598 [Thiogranum longum]